MGTHRRLGTILTLFVAMTLGACSGSDTGDTTAPPSPVAVNIANFAFAPSDVHVSVGTKVTWTNDDNVTHTVTARGGEWESGSVAAETSFDHTFDEPGEFDYFCSIHPSMTGTIIVDG